MFLQNLKWCFHRFNVQVRGKKQIKWKTKIFQTHSCLKITQISLLYLYVIHSNIISLIKLLYKLQ